MCVDIPRNQYELDRVSLAECIYFSINHSTGLNLYN